MAGSMYFLLASVLAVIGITVLLAGVKSDGQYHEPIINTDRWIDSWTFTMKKTIRRMLRFVVVHLVGWYRFVVHDITIHKTMKQKVRELLYEHHREERELRVRTRLFNKDN